MSVSSVAFAAQAEQQLVFLSQPTNTTETAPVELYACVLFRLRRRRVARGKFASIEVLFEPLRALQRGVSEKQSETRQLCMILVSKSTGFVALSAKENQPL